MICICMQTMRFVEAYNFFYKPFAEHHTLVRFQSIVTFLKYAQSQQGQRGMGNIV